MAELSGFEVLALVREIDLALRGSYINNIYSLGESQVLRLRRPEEGDRWLVASPRRGVWVSTKVSERSETSPFTSKLRGELERAKFLSASQADLDRVFVLEFEVGEGSKKLVVEMMPPGNVVLVDDDGRIGQVLREVRSPSRRLVKGGAYSQPSQRRLSPIQASPAEVAAALGKESTVGKAFGRNFSIPKKYVAETLARLGLKDEDPSSLLAGREQEAAEVLARIVSAARKSPSPCVCSVQDGEDIFAVEPRAFPLVRKGASLSELCDDLLLADVESDGVEPEAQVDERRRQAELTVMKLEADAKRLEEEARGTKARAVEAAKSESLAEALKLMEAAGLRPRRAPSTAAAAASLLYDEAKRLEEGARDSLAAAKRIGKKAGAIPEKVPSRRKVLPRRHSEWFEKFRWFRTSGGKLALGGRDAGSNSLLVKRHMAEGDTVFHADLFGSPFFVLKEGKNQNDAEVREVAQATAAFSSAWKTGLGAADAYWVGPDQVSTAAPSGEFLSRGSFAIKGKKNYVTRNILEVAVGLDERGRVVAGPESALAPGLKGYVILRPHKEKGSDTAKKVLKELQALAGEEPVEATLDEVARALPTGGGKVVRKGTESRAPGRRPQSDT
ncbi:MAG: NFACT family protein [archaeon]|nr:MAG: NFACT family protein [archaeon]